jgi:hypothetical protein
MLEQSGHRLLWLLEIINTLLVTARVYLLTLEQPRLIRQRPQPLWLPVKSLLPRLPVQRHSLLAQR